MRRFWVICIGSLSAGAPRALSGNAAALLRTLQRTRQLSVAAEAGLEDVQAATPLWGFADLLPPPPTESQPRQPRVPEVGGKSNT